MRLLRIALIVTISSGFVSNSYSVTASAGSKTQSKSSHKAQRHSKGKKNIAKSSNPGNVWERIQHGLRIPHPSLASFNFEKIQASTSTNPIISKSQPRKISGNTDTQDEFSDVSTSSDSLSKATKDEAQIPQKFRIRHVLSPQTNQLKLEANPDKKYTKLGRALFTPKEPSLEHKPDNILSVSNGLEFRSKSVQRIRTQLGLHPELFKHRDISVAEKNDKNTESGKKTNPNAPTNQQTSIRSCADLKKQVVVELAREGDLTDSYNQMVEQCRIKQNEIVERVNKQIAKYSSGFLYQVSERARPYLYHVVDALNKYNLPLDLALLPIMESAYQSTALSPKSAAGIWQFIPSTGQEYGLDQDENYDARLDVSASTHAAIRFLSGLNAHYKGDWLLALAAYNSGQGTVDAAISRNQAEGLDTDFWSLELPAETQDYVPRLLALSSIFANPGNYGLKLRPVKNEPYFIKVTIDREVDIEHLLNKDLQTIAKFANFDPEEFSSLNAAYLKPTLTERKPFSFLMPISNANHLHKSLGYLAQSTKQLEHQVLPNTSETAMSDIINKSKFQMPWLAITLGEERFWPFSKELTTFDTKPKSSDIVEPVASKTDYWEVHYLDKGETLKSVAEYHGISEEKLRQTNKIKSKQAVSLGHRLLIPLPQVALMPTKSTKSSVLYKGTYSFNPFISQI